MGIQETLKALSDPVRREILESLKDGRKSAGEIVDLFDISAPAISRHLAVLKDAGLVRDYRQGKYIFYELKASILEETMLWIANLKE
ncbi:MAG: autorepressor SdpR family transcription factor [Raoultibacter sp.]